jgi:hypothetical protein
MLENVSDHNVFDRDENVTRTSVSYKNRFGNAVGAALCRQIISPEIFSEDFKAGVDFGTLPCVDRARIGAIGVCGSCPRRTAARRTTGPASAASRSVGGAARHGSGAGPDRGGPGGRGPSR